ncbi:MAG: hypothetical protein IPI62_13165 [Bacteroidetes bacterium]|nr:hypothetical protein [Bacteroidota bacterium]
MMERIGIRTRDIIPVFYTDNVLAMEVDSSGLMWLLAIDAGQNFIYKFDGSTFFFSLLLIAMSLEIFNMILMIICGLIHILSWLKSMGQ